jgi:multidrug efflux pump subunit AcrA (membrane-fusion protein)
MTKTRTQAAALALSAFAAFGTVAGANGMARTQYAAAERVALASTLPTDVVQRVVVVGHLQAQRVVIVGHRANA